MINLFKMIKKKSRRKGGGMTCLLKTRKTRKNKDNQIKMRVYYHLIWFWTKPSSLSLVWFEIWILGCSFWRSYLFFEIFEEMLFIFYINSSKNHHHSSIFSFLFFKIFRSFQAYNFRYWGWKSRERSCEIKVYCCLIFCLKNIEISSLRYLYLIILSYIYLSSSHLYIFHPLSHSPNFSFSLSIIISSFSHLKSYIVE